MLNEGRSGFWPRALLLLVLGLVFYAPAIDNFWIKDDLAVGNLMEGESMSWRAFGRELAPIGMSAEHYWRPIPLLPGYIEHALWGLDVRGYHVTNILLQVLCAVTLMALVDRLSGRAGPASMGAALLVLLAPTGAESVVWIMQRMVLMTSLFMLLGLLAWLRALDRRQKTARYLALGCFVLALLSKEIALTLPGLFFLLELVRTGSTTGWRKSFASALRWALPGAVLIALYFLARYLFWGRIVNSYAGLDVMEYARKNRVFELLGSTLLNGLMPANPALLGSVAAAGLRAVMALCFGVALLRGGILFLRAREQRGVMILGLAFAMLSILPILPIVWIDEHLFNARFFHGPMIGIAMIAGPALFAAMPGRGARLLDRGGRASGCTLVAAYAISLSAQLVAFDRGSEQILGLRAGLVDVRTAATAEGATAPVFVALRVPDQYYGVPTLEYALVQALEPPFTSPAVTVVPLLARDHDLPGFWLADLERQIEARGLPHDGLEFVECRSGSWDIRPIFAARRPARGQEPARCLEPLDRSYRGNKGEEPVFIFESRDARVQSFRMVFRTPDIAFEFGPRLVPGRNCEDLGGGRFRFRPSAGDPEQPGLPDLWAGIVRGPLPAPLAVTWRVESLDEQGRTIAVSLEQRFLVFNEVAESTP